jgi:CheY-like chemotaxis protein
MKILIADDEEDERDHLRIILERDGHEVVAAIDGIHALDEFAKHPDAELVITDFKMPGVNGLDLLANIKGIKLDARVWFVSSHLSPKIEKMALGLGAEKAVWKTGLEHELIRAGIIREKQV